MSLSNISCFSSRVIHGAEFPLHLSFSLEEHDCTCQQHIQKFVSIYSPCIVWVTFSFKKVQRCHWNVISKAYWIEFFETSTCFNIWSRFRQRLIFLIAYNDHLSQGQIPHHGKMFEDRLLEASQLCYVCL